MHAHFLSRDIFCLFMFQRRYTILCICTRLCLCVYSQSWCILQEIQQGIPLIEVSCWCIVLVLFPFYDQAIKPTQELKRAYGVFLWLSGRLRCHNACVALLIDTFYNTLQIMLHVSYPRKTFSSKLFPLLSCPWSEEDRLTHSSLSCSMS